MSQENVEIVRRVFNEMERGNFRIAEYLDPKVHVTWVNPVYGDSGGDSHGIREVAEGLLALFEALGDVTWTAEQIIDAGDRVVTVESWRARGKASGAEAEARQASVWTISDGKITRIVGYADPAEALEAAGLRE
jgi:ketosteroid isomerase-like protein